MRCTECRSGRLRPALRNKAAPPSDGVAVVTHVPILSCSACAEAQRLATGAAGPTVFSPDSPL